MLGYIIIVVIISAVCTHYSIEMIKGIMKSKIKPPVISDEKLKDEFKNILSDGFTQIIRLRKKNNKLYLSLFVLNPNEYILWLSENGFYKKTNMNLDEIIINNPTDDLLYFIAFKYKYFCHGINKMYPKLKNNFVDYLKKNPKKRFVDNTFVSEEFFNIFVLPNNDKKEFKKLLFKLKE